MRGVFTSGVLDAFMKHELYFPYIVAVSAGACNGLSYMSRQPRRARYSNIDMLQKYGYISLKSLLTHGSIFDPNILYERFPNEIVPFDYNAYEHNPAIYEMVTTNCLTGRAEYLSEKHDFRRMTAIARASSSLPYLSQITCVDGIPMLDGGIVDSIIMRIMDGMSAFPYILLAMVLMTVFGQGLFNVVLAVGIGNIPSFARVVRGEVFIVKHEEYCNAARVMGISTSRMLFTHILPNTISPLIVYATLGVAGSIISEAALSVLGLGVSEPTASWGSILQTGKYYLNTAPHIATYSGLFILLTVLGFNLLGDGIRDVLDPKMKK